MDGQGWWKWEDKGDKIMESDIAVIEQYDPEIYKWFVVAYVGPDRTDGRIDCGGVNEENRVELRIRYLRGFNEKRE